MNYKEHHDAFINIMMDLHIQIGTNEESIYNELMICFNITKEQFFLENSKFISSSKEVKMFRFDENDRIRDYNEEQFKELIKLMKE